MITKLNCRFIGDNMKRMTKALCVKFVPTIFWFSFLLGFMGCCACCAMPCTFYLNRNLAVPAPIIPFSGRSSSRMRKKSKQQQARRKVLNKRKRELEQKEFERK